MRFMFTLVASLFLFPAAIQAQDRPNTILVLDASGSMWGQIDGVNKIVIAREVVAGILDDFPEDQNLGLTVYGHRVRGECTDIETIVQPGIDNRQAILDAVNAINPRGMTPMTDAVIAAAESLRYTEQKATVILVSDGIETCAPDPCAAARALEEAGVDFTAHVVGFDVTEADALAQMQCLAYETGGTFVSASNADELSAALEAVVAAAPEPQPAPEPETVADPRPFVVTFRAYLGDESTEITDSVLWDLSLDGSVFNDDARGAPLMIDLTDGTYVVTATYGKGADALSQEFTVAGMDKTVSIVFPVPVPEASILAPDTVVAGSTLPVGWEGPDDELDTIQIGLPGEVFMQYAYTSTGNPVALQMPAEPGVYELRYMWRDATQIAARPITVTEAALGLTAPETAPAGSTIDVGWSGPAADLDNIQIGPVGTTENSDYDYVDSGNPVQIIMPSEPGDYELRYSFQDVEIIFTRPITVTEAEVSMTAPDSAVAGSTITVEWVGPAADLDNIQIGLPGEGYVGYGYVTAGEPLQLLMPTAPGAYELRYAFRDSEIIATRPITVTEVTAALTAPSTGKLGEMLAVGYDGPSYSGDFIGIARSGESGYLNYAMIGSDNPVMLQLPDQPGTYDVRYFLGQGEVAIGEPVTVTIGK